MNLFLRCRESPQGADPHPSFLYAREGARRNHLKEEITPLLPTGIGERRAIQPYHIKFRTCIALAPMRTPPINESAELTQGALYSSYFSTLRESRHGIFMKKRALFAHCSEPVSFRPILPIASTAHRARKGQEEGKDG